LENRSWDQVSFLIHLHSLEDKKIETNPDSLMTMERAVKVSKNITLVTLGMLNIMPLKKKSKSLLKKRIVSSSLMMFSQTLRIRDTPLIAQVMPMVLEDKGQAHQCSKIVLCSRSFLNQSINLHTPSSNLSKTLSIQRDPLQVRVQDYHLQALTI